MRSRDVVETVDAQAARCKTVLDLIWVDVQQSTGLVKAQYESAMSAIEYMKCLLSVWMTSTTGQRLQLAVWDISRARFYGSSEISMFVHIPEGMNNPGKVALLNKTMYGTRDAANIWANIWAKELQASCSLEAGFANPA